jgi:hypothetical protein
MLIPKIIYSLVVAALMCMFFALCVIIGVSGIGALWKEIAYCGLFVGTAIVALWCWALYNVIWWR